MSVIVYLLLELSQKFLCESHSGLEIGSSRCCLAYCDGKKIEGRVLYSNIARYQMWAPFRGARWRLDRYFLPRIRRVPNPRAMILNEW